MIRLEDGTTELAVRTIKRRLSSVSGLFWYLVARGDAGVSADPVPHGVAIRRTRDRPTDRGLSLLRGPRTLPRILLPERVDALASCGSRSAPPSAARASTGTPSVSGSASSGLLPASMTTATW